MKLFDVPMVENDVNAKTVGEYLKMLLLYLWAEAEQFNSKRPFGNGGWQYDVYASLIKAGYEIGELDEDGYVQEVDYAKADKLITDAIDAEFAEPVKQGRWIMRGGWFRCSECDEKTLCKRIGGTGGFSYELEQVRSKRCPNCGAKMDEEDEA